MDSYLEQLQQELENAMAGATPSDLAKGAEGKWSSGQILEHLYLTYRGTNKGIAKCLEAGAPLATRATLKQRVQSFVVLDLGYFPNGRKSPERVIPRGMACEEVSRAILPEIRQMQSGLADCERRFGARTKVLDHLILGPLTAGQWRKFHLMHGRHHARQIRQRLGRA
jgi:Protein of unknown function (DUF1569)